MSRNFCKLAIVAALTFMAGSLPAWADNAKNPVITEARTDAGNTLLHIIGANFSGGTPKLTLGNGGVPLAITLATPAQIDAVLPAGIPPGSYLLSLTISKSGEDARSDEFWVTLGGAGSQGPAGPAGPQGPAGQTGLPGPKGSDGINGTNGAAGPAGPTGSIGPIGPIGPKGSDGINGTNGAAGPAGPTGPIGPKGSDGMNGTNGEVWAQSRNGDLVGSSTGDGSLTLAAGFSYWISARVPVQGGDRVAPVVTCMLVQDSPLTVLDAAVVTVNPKLEMGLGDVPAFSSFPGLAILSLGATISLPAGGGNATVTLICQSDSPLATTYMVPLLDTTSFPLLRAIRLNSLDALFIFPPL
jgi:hypothetical protein